MTKKILCAVDDTEYSKAAVSVAAELAKATDSEITFLAVNQMMGSYAGTGPAYLWDNAIVERVLNGATATAKQAGVRAFKAANAKSRDVGRAIVAFAEDNGIDHIVVGTGGKSGVTRLMLGSVSHDVLARAHCPVTVARLHA